MLNVAVYGRKAIDHHLQGVIQTIGLDLSHFPVSRLQLWAAADDAKYGKYRTGPGWWEGVEELCATGESDSYWCKAMVMQVVKNI